MREPDEFIKYITPGVLKTLSLLEEAGHRAYIVGGAVRDLLLGRTPDDFDVATSAEVSETVSVLSRYKTIPTGLSHGTVTAIVDGEQIEITTFRKDGDYRDHRHPEEVEFTSSLSEDLKRRDFTVNAMAFSPSSGLVDENGGLCDLENKVIRCVGDPNERFSEDALRILRALRFSAKLGFDIEANTKKAAIEKRKDLNFVSKERINQEFSKLIASDDTETLKKIFLSELKAVIFEIIPELKTCEETPQINSVHCYDVYTHSVLSVCAVRNDPVLRLTMLLHDVSKPKCLRIDGNGMTHFTNHAAEGAVLSEKILTDLRYPKKVVSDVKQLIFHHEFFRDPLVKSGQYGKAAGKLIRLTGSRLALLMPEIMLADSMAKKPSCSAEMKIVIENLDAEIKRIISENKAVTGPKSLDITGGDLIRAGIPKGRIMGEIVKKLVVLASEFEVKNEKKELGKRAKQIFKEEYSVDNKQKLVEMRYKYWTAAPCFDGETKKELITANEKSRDDIYDRFYRDLEFGTAGLRGVMGAGTNRMNVYVVRRVSYAVALFVNSFGREAAERGIAVSYDTRQNSELFAKEAAAVFASCGIKTRIFRKPAPVPVLSYTVWSGNFQAGIMITASHNPKQYNGYKVYWEGGVQITPSMAEEITKIIDENSDIGKIPVPSFQKEVRKSNLSYFGDDTSEKYIERIAALKVDKDLLEENADRITAVYTPLFGAGARYVGKAAERLGFGNFHIVRSQMRADGSFPGLTVPNPENPAALEKGIKLAKKLKADIVFGTDPDSDRMGAAVRQKDGSYKNLTGNEIGCLFMDYLIGVRKRNGCMPENAFAVSTIVSTDLAGEIAKANGVEFKSVLTGFKFIGDLITEENKDDFILGFEESYGFLTEGYARDKDGVAAGIILCEMALYNKVVLGRSLADALADIHKRFGYRSESSFSVELPGESGHDSILKLMAGLRRTGALVLKDRIKAIDDVYEGTKTVFGSDGKVLETEKLDLPKSDVLKYYLEDGWFAVRPSGTEPKVKIYVGIKDFKSEEECVKKAAAIKELLGKTIRSMIG